MTEKRSTPLENAELPDGSVEHLHGPEEVDYAEDELMVVCLVRDGRPYVKSFVEHYRSLGARHIAFLDNGSTDGTVEALSEYDAVTVQRTGLPYKDYKHALKRYLIFNFGQKDRWCLCADIDEFFDYPYSDVVSLGLLLSYLSRHSYTAMVTQMLDMFPEEPLSGRAESVDEPLKERHRFYDVSNIRRRSMKERSRHYGNTLESKDVESFRGGIRDTVFDTDPVLTKRSLVFLDDKVKPLDGGDHMIGGARIADITGVLFHYKFVDEYFQDRVALAVQEENYAKNSAKYKLYKEVLEEEPNLLMKLDTARELKSVNDLLEDQFVVISENYANLVNAEEEKRIRRTLEARPVTLTEPYLEYRRRELEKTLRVQSLERQLRESGQGASRERAREEKKRRRELQIVERQLRERSKENWHLKQRADALERQLAGIQSSWAWKLMTLLHRIKSRMLGIGKGMS